MNELPIPIPRPSILPPQPEAIPAILRAESRWMVWRLEWRTKPKPRWNKTPYNAHTHHWASSTKRETWSDLETAWKAYEASLNSSHPYSGIGYALGDEWVGVDLDGCRRIEDGTIEPWARSALRRVQGYVEVSVSGTGVHVICRGRVPEGKRERDDKNAEHRGIALYDKGRYFTISGCVLPESAVIEDITPQLGALHTWLFANGQPKSPAASATAGSPLQYALDKDAKLRQLWSGDTSGYASQSEADLGLTIKLIFWFGRDPARIDELFRQSGLMRDKWERQDYRERTITTALAWQSETRTMATAARASGVAAVAIDKLAPSVELLNALAVFSGRIVFVAVRRRGPMIIGATDKGPEIVWPSTTELANFGKSRAIIADATSVFLPTPPQRQVRATWEPAASLLLRLASADGILLENALREETRDLLRLMWRQSGQSAAKTGEDFIEFMRTILSTRRDPHGEAPPSVFVAEGQAWVHVPTLRTWLSTPGFMNKLYPLADIRNGLLLLGFAYFENLSRGFEGDSESLCLWRGPLEVLEE
jgi:hypothetical protein